MLAGSYLSNPLSGLANFGFTSVIGVRARGAMQFTVTLYRLSSRARIVVIVIMPPLADP